LNIVTLKSISIFQCAVFVLCIGLESSFNFAIAEDDSSDPLLQTLNLNFSPENREKLRRALNDYARSVDPDHMQIEERRRAMQDSIKTRFLEADSDADGTVDRLEATEKLPQIARHFNGVDINQDGLISLDELQVAQARISERRKAAELAIEAKKLQEVDVTTSSKRKNIK
jgi:hypothetical protein